MNIPQDHLPFSEVSWVEAPNDDQNPPFFSNEKEDFSMEMIQEVNSKEERKKEK